MAAEVLDGGGGDKGPAATKRLSRMLYKSSKELVYEVSNRTAYRTRRYANLNLNDQLAARTHEPAAGDYQRGAGRAEGPTCRASKGEPRPPNGTPREQEGASEECDGAQGHQGDNAGHNSTPTYVQRNSCERHSADEWDIWPSFEVKQWQDEWFTRWRGTHEPIARRVSCKY